MAVYETHDATVYGGKVVLSRLPFADGQRVRVTVVEVDAPKRMSIHEVRRRPKGSVTRFDDPFEPMIPEEDWDMLR